MARKAWPQEGKGASWRRGTSPVPFQIWNDLRPAAPPPPRRRSAPTAAASSPGAAGASFCRRRRPPAMAARCARPGARPASSTSEDFSTCCTLTCIKHPTLDLSRRTPDRGQPSSVTVCAKHRTGLASTSRWVHVRIMSRGVAQQSTSPAVELASLRHGIQVGSSSEPRCVHTCRVPPKTRSERVEDGGSKAGAEADESNV